MGDRFRLAVVGCGRISTSHLKGIQELPDQVELVATVDNDPERAQAAAAQYGAQRWYGSAAEAFRDPEIEGVVLALPHYLHYPLTIEALAAGKHVLVEKPMSNSYPEAADMVDEAARLGLTLMVGQSRRYYDAVQESRRRIEDVGTIINTITTWNVFLEKPATGWWSHGSRAGGLLIALNGSHAVDYVTWMMNKLPKSVYARTLRNNESWEGEDEVVMVLDYGEQLSTIHLSFNTRVSTHTRLVVGTTGTMSLSGEEVLVVNGETVVSGTQSPSSFAVQIGEFASSVRDRREPQTSGRVVAPTIAILDAARCSAQTGRVVEVEEMMR